jgi:hypothetical protein
MATAVQAAEHVHLSPSRFRDLIGTVFTKSPSGKYNLDRVRKEYCLHAQKVMAGRGEDGSGALSKQRVKLEGAKTEAIEFRNAVNRGDYVSLELFAKEVDEMIMALREIALGTAGKISDIMADACGCDRALAFRIIDDEIREMLTVMSNPARKQAA